MIALNAGLTTNTSACRACFPGTSTINLADQGYNDTIRRTCATCPLNVCFGYTIGSMFHAFFPDLRAHIQLAWLLALPCEHIHDRRGPILLLELPTVHRVYDFWTKYHPSSWRLTLLSAVLNFADPCVCDVGAEFVASSCAPCSGNKYKSFVGNALCTPCPSGSRSVPGFASCAVSRALSLNLFAFYFNAVLCVIVHKRLLFRKCRCSLFALPKRRGLRW